MTIQIIVIIVMALSALINFIQFKVNNNIREDLEDEIERVILLKSQLARTKELQKKVTEIDIKIEVKKNERKKLSKKDKLAAANNRP